MSNGSNDSQKENKMAEKDKTFYDELREKFKESTGLQDCPSLFELWMKGYRVGRTDAFGEASSILDSIIEDNQ